MDTPIMEAPRTVAEDTELLGAYFPIPGFGILPINAYLIHAAEPVLLDTGLAALGTDFLAHLNQLIDPRTLRWVWLTHTDPDHLGNLRSVLDIAPNARLITTFLGMGKLGLQQMPLDRVYLLNPGQTLDVGDRLLMAVKPPTFDAPETTGCFDCKTRVLFSSDCFGALMGEPAEDATDIASHALRDGCITWATIDAPWLQNVDTGKYAASLDAIHRLDPEVVLSSHLPPARGMHDILLGHLSDAAQAATFVGPDQTALEQMMALSPVS